MDLARSPADAQVVRRARAAFEDAFGALAAQVAVAPGRVNLIGEHTDYNEGFVLPMAIDRAVAVAFVPRLDDVVRVYAAHFRETREMSVATPGGRSHAWDAYVAGVIWTLAGAGYSLRGADLAIVGDVPVGAGLSSSAALELATARALCATSSIEWNPREMARLARTAENDFVGVACGMMDQFASAMSAQGSALLLDCRSLETELVRIPREACVVVMDSGTRRSLATTAYNERRASCERAVAVLQGLDPRVNALRDVDETLLARGHNFMDDETYRRASHVVAETERPVALARSFQGGDLVRAGALMNDSHASLRDLYEVSCAELDVIVSAAQAHPACYGARLTGAGFGGCAIALVAVSDVDAFVAAISEDYRRQTGADASMFVTAPASGAHLIE